jgi:hypothetical protein
MFSRKKDLEDSHKQAIAANWSDCIGSTKDPSCNSLAD